VVNSSSVELARITKSVSVASGVTKDVLFAMMESV